MPRNVTFPWLLMPLLWIRLCAVSFLWASQAAIQGISKPNKQSGQTIFILAIQMIQDLTIEHQLSTKIQWILEYRNIKGNEKADEAAKKAARLEENDINILRSIQILISLQD